MKVFPLVYFLFIAVVSAEVPSLINYQGRLTNADGDPLRGSVTVGLKIFDAQTGGNLLYTEDVGAIQLGEGGVYSFQFGGKGSSNTRVTETVGNGDGENLYQKILSNTPVVEGSVSVSDGTYTWSQESGSSNEDDFSSSFSKNLSRITVNYFAGAPDDGRDITVTYRHQKTGITGALTGGAEQWMELTVDGETQATRQRIGAVPYALKAGSVDETARRTAVKVYKYSKKLDGEYRLKNVLDESRHLADSKMIFDIPERAKKLISLKFNLRRYNRDRGSNPSINLRRASFDGESDMIGLQLEPLPKNEVNEVKNYKVLLNWELDRNNHNELLLNLESTDHEPSSLVILEYEY